MLAGWLPNYFITIQTPNTFANRNIMRYNLKLLTKIFQPKISIEIRIFSLGRKNNILKKQQQQKKKTTKKRKQCIIFLINHSYGDTWRLSAQPVT